MIEPRPLILGFAAYSGTGKTTLLSQLIPHLRAQGYQLAVIKHSHHQIELDTPGKDSYQLRMAGANPVVLATPNQQILIQASEPNAEANLSDSLALLAGMTLDFILVEGFRDAPIAKIELHRPQLGKPLLYPSDPHIIAVASDVPLALPANLPGLDLNHVAEMVAFIIALRHSELS